MSKEKVNLFSKPAEIDAVIMSKLSQFSTRGGKVKNDLLKWSPEELELRDGVIMDYLTVNMLSREQTARQIADRWDITMATSRKYVQQAIERFCDNQVAETESVIRKRFEEQVNSVMQEAMEAGDRNSTLKALDILAKSAGIYREKSDVNVNLDGKIKFDFGNNE